MNTINKYQDEKFSYKNAKQAYFDVVVGDSLYNELSGFNQGL